VVTTGDEGPLAVRRMGSGPRVVLVHGFTQTGRSFEPLAGRLAPDYEVLLPDLPGHGDSPPAAGDLHRAAAELGASCGAATYVGYSLGGRVCLHLGLDRPQLVRALVLISATAGIEDAEERARRATSDADLAERIARGGDEALADFIDEWLCGPLFSHLPAEVSARESRLANSAEGLASSLRAHGAGSQIPLFERLSELSMPTLVVTGERDAKFTAVGARMAAAIGENASFVLVADAGHAVPLERPEETLALIKRAAA
jgi:2-succinyl-6-hydroxy-2,4-cyclohexadiene-1-carboxylate synthase